MNKITIDFPELFQSNAFCMWLEREGFDLFKDFYSEKMPKERQPQDITIEYGGEWENNYITIE
ncbi:MAG: hypothetical protein ABI091_26925 [Ferruginibacter sp.]